MNTKKNNKNKDLNNDELIIGIQDVIKIREVHHILDDFRYPSLHLKIILSKVLLEHFKGEVQDVKEFLCEYDEQLLELVEPLEK